MSLPRVTMQDIARVAGVHQTTVSLALRNDPRLPEATRLRLRRIADELGYRPDPMLSALNVYRSARQPTRGPVTMAFLVNFRDRRELVGSYPHRLFLEGARQQAEQLGYRLEVFYAGHATGGATEAQRIGRVLRARGITGLILAAFSDEMVDFPMSWENFSAVQIESRQLGLALHTVSNHQFLIAREAVRRLAARGYRRIGLIVGERDETHLQNAFSGGYYVGVAQSPSLVRLPPLLLDRWTIAETAPGIDTWAREHAVEAIVSNWSIVPAALRAKGWRLPRQIVVASLDFAPGAGANAGMRQNHAIVGARAVEQLALLMKTNQRGLVATPNLTLIEGEWIDGSDVPPRRPERGDRTRSSASAIAAAQAS